MIFSAVPVWLVPVRMAKSSPFAQLSDAMNFAPISSIPLLRDTEIIFNILLKSTCNYRTNGEFREKCVSGKLSPSHKLEAAHEKINKRTGDGHYRGIAGGPDWLALGCRQCPVQGPARVLADGRARPAKTIRV